MQKMCVNFVRLPFWSKKKYLLFYGFSFNIILESGKKWVEVEQSGTKLHELVVIGMFKGEYNHTIDTKGRLIIPSKFREILGENFVVTKGLDGCLFVYGNTEWFALEKALKTLPLASKDSRKFSRFFLAGAVDVEVDKQGRILIPSVLREFAALESQVVLLGVGERIEIWSKDRWEEASEYDDMDDIAEHMSELGLMI